MVSRAAVRREAQQTEVVQQRRKVLRLGRLPEPARAEEKGVAYLFQLVQEAGLVDVQGVLAAHRLEVGPAVGYLWIRGAQLDASCRVLPRYYSLKRWQASTCGRSHVRSRRGGNCG